MASRHREEVLNVTLAELLSGLGLEATPESIVRQIGRRGRALPDVLVQYRGMRLVIEGKYGDAQQAKQSVLRQSQNRINSGVAHIALAILYSPELRTTPFSKLQEAMQQSTLEFCILSEVGVGRWHNGDIANIPGELRRAHESHCKEDVVQTAAESIRGCLDGVAMLFETKKSVCDELSKVLGIVAASNENADTKRRRIHTVTRVAALTLENAFIFQEQLAASEVKGVSSLRTTLRYTDFVDKTIKHWDWICHSINYVPIFRLASEILSKIPASSAADAAVRVLADKALEVSANQAALRHDLMGRIYHYLLHEAKYLGTYYTSVPAATLLAKLVTDPAMWPTHNFGEEKTFKNFKVTDLTCGTGTLLMAACQALTDNFVVASAKNGKTITEKRLAKLHALYMENVAYGYDVLPSAIHLTASTLSLLSPEVQFHKLHLYSMPLDIKDGKPLLGSLEFIDQHRSQTQFNLFASETSQTETRGFTEGGYGGKSAELPITDLFIMNPPFTRSVGDNLLFGNLPADKRVLMQKELKSRVGKAGFSASITAGLGSVFLALADRYIRSNGRVAFVLPAAFATGIAWEESRRLLGQRYHLEYVVVSHEPGRWNFSENTELSEIMFIARRLAEEENNEDLQTTFVNLWKNPTNAGDALALARLIRLIPPPQILTKGGQGIASLYEEGCKYGESMLVPMRTLKQGWWPTAFAQTELTRLAYALGQGKLTLPGIKKLWQLPLAPLYQIAELGPDRRDIHDGFVVTDTPTPYKCFWNHDATKTLSIDQKANSYLSPRSTAAAGRTGIRDVGLLWPKAGSLLLSETTWLISQRLCAVLVKDVVLSNTWWPVRFRKPDPRKERALALWQNSTIGLSILIMSRVPSKGAWIKFRKPSLLLLPVLNVDSLSEIQLDELSIAYDRLGQLKLEPFSRLAEDDVRTAIDIAIAAVLGLPDLTALREMLAQEPVLTNKALVPEESEPLQETPQLELLFA